MTDNELLQALYNDMQGMKNDMQGMKDDMQGMKDDMQGMKNDLQIVKQKTTDIELHLENVTDKNIQTIAEGHLDLNRRLDDALKVESEKEMFFIRVRVLEDEVRKIKERLTPSA